MLIRVLDQPSRHQVEHVLHQVRCPVGDPHHHPEQPTHRVGVTAQVGGAQRRHQAQPPHPVAQLAGAMQREKAAQGIAQQMKTVDAQVLGQPFQIAHQVVNASVLERVG